MNIKGGFIEETLRQENKWILIEEIRNYIRSTEQSMRAFEQEYFGEDIDLIIADFKKGNKTKEY